MKRSQIPKNIDEYIADCPAEYQPLLQELRAVIRKAAPGSIEKISYRMPCFYQKGNLVYFALFQKHIGFFPTASGIKAFKNELGERVTGKGTVQFKLTEPIPFDLITRIVEYRVAENLNNL